VTEPVVDVVIPVHTDRRPIARATASVLTTATVETRVSVVCHNVEVGRIAAVLGDWASHPRVRLLPLVDGFPSPAGPINAGLDAATGEFTALLGSDDEYESGAIDAWVAVARRDRADLVIPPLRATPRGPTKSPPTRPGRTRRLDGVRDRLAYRTVQLGLARREIFGQVRMTPGLRSGEDVVQGATLWYSGTAISRLRRGPGYLIHDDDPEQRVSTTPKPAAESLLFLDTVLDRSFTDRLTPAQRESFAVKILRTHIMDVIGLSLRAGSPADDLVALRSAVTRVQLLAPTAVGILSRREATMLLAVLRTDDLSTLAGEHAAHTDYRRLAALPGNLIPSTLRHLLHREAPLRFLGATAFMR
jgi:hypothetical protein